MKKLIATTVMAVLGTTLSFGAAPKCSSINDIMKVLDSKGISDVVSMELEHNMWVVRHGKDGEKVQQILVKCSPDSPDKHLVKKYYHTTPPAASLSIQQISERALKEDTGVISKIEYRNSQWEVTITEGTVDTELSFSIGGELLSRVVID